MKHPIPAACLLALLASAPAAQICGGLTVSVTPNPAPFGSTVTATYTNNTAGPITLPVPCVFRCIHQGVGTGGPVVYSVGCATVLHTLMPGDQLSQLWDQEDDTGQQVLPGPYTLDLVTPGPISCTAGLNVLPCTQGSLVQFGQGCGMGSCPFFSFGTPVLYAKSCPVIGQTLELSVSEADCGSAVLLLLGTSNTSAGGIPLPFPLGGGCNLLVSPDLSVPGTIDSLGRASFPLAIPPNPGLVGGILHTQILTPGPPLKMSNGLTITIG